MKIAGESARRSELTDRQVDTISTCVLFLLQFPLWQCTNTDSYTSSESASEIRLSWPSFIEYSGQPLDRSWTPGQPKLNPSHVNTEYDSASEQSDGSKHSTGEQSIPHTFKIDFKGLPLTKIQNEGNCITSRKQEGLRMSLDLLKDSPMAIQKYVLDRCLKAKNFKYRGS